MAPTTRCSSLTGTDKQMRYAYAVTLVGVVLAGITTAYTAIRSFMFAQAIRSRPFIPPGNFTATRQFGNFTGPRQFGNINPYGGFINNLVILAVVIAIIGVVWLGISLRKSKQL
jgi:hypothetical protein